GSACELTGGVGRARLRVVVPGDVPQVVALHGAIDGTPQLDRLPSVSTQPLGDHTEIVAPVPVPAAHDGAIWAIGAQIYATQTAAVSATIHAPTIASKLTCGSACSVGQATGLQITAPAQIQPLQARVDTTLDGVPQIGG